MWSGPRNISTAMMRSWGSRADTAVVDEPLYAAYLAATGLDHPGRDDIIAACDTDAGSVVQRLTTGGAASSARVMYQKHMAHHLPEGCELGWTDALVNMFLVREPAAMVRSLTRVLPNADLEATGLPQQVRLFEYASGVLGCPAPVFDAADVLRDPPGSLGLMCNAAGIDFDDAMLRWDTGPRDTDGVWAEHWYGAVCASTGFEPYVPPAEAGVPRRYLGLLRACEPLYAKLAEHAVRSRSGDASQPCRA